MSFPRYRKYKDSGVEWLGEVPGHWAAPPLYLRYSVELGKMLDSSRITGDHLVPYLRNVDVQWGRINFNDLPEMDIEASEYGRYTVAPGDLLVCEGGEVGRAAIVPERSNTIGFQKALHRLRALSNDEHPPFMYFTLSWAALRGVFNQGGLSTIAHLTGEQLRKYRFPKPPIAEQVKIAAFLDRETAKIDALVAEQQNLIALLKEKRQALISHAVTKGLDPDVPMKDSGVAWLGEVPAHWVVLMLSRVASERCDGPFGSGIKSEHYTDSGALVVRLQNIRSNGFFVGEPAFLELEYFDEALKRHEVLPGDLLIAGLGDENNVVGRACVAPPGISPALVKADCFRFRLDGSVAAAAFVAAQLNVSAVADAGRLANGSTRSRIPLSVMATRVITLPPLAEQVEIITFIERERAAIDELVGEAAATIALLQERRTALISAAVTGKIDVRHLAVATADATPEPA